MKKQLALNLKPDGKQPFPNEIKFGKETIHLINVHPCKSCGAWPVFKIGSEYRSDGEKGFNFAVCELECPFCYKKLTADPKTYANNDMEAAFLEIAVEWNQPIHPNYLEAVGLIDKVVFERGKKLENLDN